MLDSGWYVLGKEVEAFEREYAAFCGTRHCIGLGNGLERARADDDHDGRGRVLDAPRAAAGAGLGIRANSISPGMTSTPETAQFIDDPNGPVPGLIARTPSRRVGQPRDIAKLVAFLASDDSSYINGANIVIDGGVSAMGG